MDTKTGNIHKQDIVILDRGDYTSCTVNLHGANITSWRVNGQEMIFVSRYSHFSGLSRILGGIQFVFPVLGEWRFGPRDGFARLQRWTITEGPAKTRIGDVYAIFCLTDNDYSHSLWNHKFQLYYKITLHMSSLAFDMRVENPSQYACLDFIAMQHALMRVRHTRRSQIVGLKECMYKDIINNATLVDHSDTVRISERMNRVYVGSPTEVVIRNTVKGGDLVIRTQKGSNINLWNPWSDEPLRMKESEDNDEYQYFIGVGAGIMSDPIRIEPLSCWSAIQIFEFIEPIQDIPRSAMVKHFYDWFNGFC